MCDIRVIYGSNISLYIYMVATAAGDESVFEKHHPMKQIKLAFTQLPLRGGKFSSIPNTNFSLENLFVYIDREAS